jgi:hypothetical protein
MTMVQLNPAIPVMTPLGEGYAQFIIDYSAEHDLYWTVFITKTGECWTFSNREIRAVKNITLGRMMKNRRGVDMSHEQGRINLHNKDYTDYCSIIINEDDSMLIEHNHDKIIVDEHQLYYLLKNYINNHLQYKDD